MPSRRAPPPPPPAADWTLGHVPPGLPTWPPGGYPELAGLSPGRRRPELFGENLNNSESSDDSSDDEQDAAAVRRSQGQKTVPGYRSTTLEETEDEADDFVTPYEDGFAHVERHNDGLLTDASFLHIVSEATAEINPFCMSLGMWERAITVGRAFFRTHQDTVATDHFRDFLLLFGITNPIDLDNEDVVLADFTKSKTACQTLIKKGSLFHPEAADDEDPLLPAGVRCYICSYRAKHYLELDRHIKEKHLMVEGKNWSRRAYLDFMGVYKQAWKSKMALLLARGIEVADNHPETKRCQKLGWHCSVCYSGYASVAELDEHFMDEHEEERRRLFFSMWNGHFEKMKQLLVDFNGRKLEEAKEEDRKAKQEAMDAEIAAFLAGDDEDLLINEDEEGAGSLDARPRRELEAVDTSAFADPAAGGQTSDEVMTDAPPLRGNHTEEEDDEMYD